MTQSIIDRLCGTGFAHVDVADMMRLLAPLGLTDWDGFAKSWDDLGVDVFMADGGRYRKRRFAVFSYHVATGERVRKPHQPHYQSTDYNPLNGGIARWFLPILPVIGMHPALDAILELACRVFTTATPAELRPVSWHIEAHQFRIEAAAGSDGKPTPEGMHRDGVDYVLVLLVRRENVQSGMTTIHSSARKLIGSFTLAEPLESAFVDDAVVFHGVTAVQPIDHTRPAYRDVLVITLRRE